MTYWTYWYDAYSSGYEKENHYFKEKENADKFIAEHEFYCKGYYGECEAKDKYEDKKPEFDIIEITLEDG